MKRLRHYFPAMAALLLAVTPVHSQPAPKVIPSRDDAPPGVNKLDDKTVAPPWVEIAADPILTTLQAPAPARWVQVDDGCRVIPSGDGKTCTFAAVTQGRYRLVVVPEKGDPLRVAVTVGKVDPPAPPKPQPPVPPPAPQSELGKKLQAAFDADPMERAAKLKLVAIKAELYRQAAALASDLTVTSTGALLARVKAAATALGVDGLAGIRTLVAGELAAVMPTDTPLTAEIRTAAAAVFTKVMSALKEVR